MTYQQFEKLFKAIHPSADVAPHDKCHGTGYRCVSISFAPGGKLYNYSGSYGAILSRFGIRTIEKQDYNFLHERLTVYQNSQDDDWGFGPVDYTQEIKEIEATLRDIETGKIILV